jgi:hypothetical protein
VCIISRPLDVVSARVSLALDLESAFTDKAALIT